MLSNDCSSYSALEEPIIKPILMSCMWSMWASNSSEANAQAPAPQAPERYQLPHRVLWWLAIVIQRNLDVDIYIYMIGYNIMQYAIITSDLSSMHDIELYHNM